MDKTNILIFITAIFLGLFVLNSCSSEKIEPTLFEKISSEHSGISFINEVENTADFNIFSYRNFYNGGGVSMGDINNDGLTDVYLTNNLGKNKLYLNKGNFQFEDITAAAGVGGTKAWSTGVAMVDINNDGYLDIYVCNAGYVKGDNHENELFINNKNNPDGSGQVTFTEAAAEYNLNENGYTTHAAFFDYDMDGDLDCYILNNSFIPVNTLNYSNKRELYAEDWDVKDFVKGGGDKLLRNDNGKFTNVTKEAGIYGSLIGFGLGITIGDVNGDNLPDMYVSNDFFERDYLYINNGDGTFNEDIKTWIEHLSLSSMGADMADINNDGYPEIFVTEMLPDDDYRLKTVTLFEDYKKYYLALQKDFYHQYMHNTLHFNNKDESFSEIAHYSGVEASDWSWGALMFDADNDGYRDLYICNGVYQDVTDQDFINFFADDVMQKMAMTGKKEELQKVLEAMPSNPLPNKVYKNNKDLTFDDVGKKWGLDMPSFSNGAAYGDLDNDGDLDLIVNNLNQEAFLYKNNSETFSDNHHLTIQLKGSKKNTFSIGSKVYLHKGEEKLNFQMIPTRGFQSSIDYKMVFGLGTSEKVDSVVVIWADQTKSVIENPMLDTLLLIDYSKINKTQLSDNNYFTKSSEPIFKEKETLFASHKEDAYVDFFREGLIYKMLSKEGPNAAVGDVNGDGLEDVFIGGASRQAGQLYLQTAQGFTKNEKDFKLDNRSEDTVADFFDAAGDGDLDLFVGSGGNFQKAGEPYLQDRLYMNDGKGNFSLNVDAFPLNGFNTSVALPFDFDKDGDLDLFVGNRSIPRVYGLNPKCYLYENDGKGNFKNVTATIAPGLDQPGMITDAQLVDVTGNGEEELIVIGEWMSPMIFGWKDGQLRQRVSNLSEHSGWWYAITSDDVDGDGDQDLILGNRGENFYFDGNKEEPVKLWLNDFDDNKSLEKIVTQTINGRDMPVQLKRELTDQIVSLKRKNNKHTEYAKRSIQELFSPEVIKKTVVKEGNYFKSAVALNDGKGNFTMMPLPKEVQFSCVCDVYCKDLNNDGKKDLILGGNDSHFAPQYSKLDASFGHVLLNQGDGNYKRVENKDAGFFIRGDIKEFVEINIQGKPHLMTVVNNQTPKLFQFISQEK